MFHQKEMNDNRRWANLFLMIALSVGIVLAFLVPPFAVPDEQAHYTNICRISEGHLFADVVDGKIGCIMSSGEIRFFQEYAGRYHGADAEGYSFEDLKDLLSEKVTESEGFLPISLADINPFAYLIPAIGLAVLKLLFGQWMNAYLTMQAIRLINLTVAVLLMRLAIQKTVAFPKTMFLFGLMPMTLFLLPSCSYDAILIPAAYVLFAYMTRIFAMKDGKVLGKEEIFAVLFSMAVFAAAKPIYVLLVLLMLAVPVKKFGGIKRYLFCIGLVAAVGIVFYLLPTLIGGSLIGAFKARPTAEKLSQNAYVREHLLEMPGMLSATVKHFFGYWAESFFGILGWLDTYFPDGCSVAFFALLLVTAFSESGVQSVLKMKWLGRVLAILSFLLIAAVIIFFMYYNENPRVGIVGGNIAYGVQGRYFIPVVLFLLFAVSNGLKLENKRFQKAISWIASATGVGYSLLTVGVLIIKYWS